MDRRSHVYAVDLRYQGQNYEINIALSQAMLDMLASGDSQAIMDRFNGQHQVTYGYQLTGRAVQIVNLRVTAIGMMPALPWPRPGARLPAQQIGRASCRDR